MHVHPRRLSVMAAIGLVLLFASCERKSPTSPPPLPTPTAPTPALVRLELVAPTGIAPGETVQLTANGVRADGSVENVSAKAQWTPATSGVLTVSSTGLATGRDRGEVVVRAHFGGLSANARVYVLPTGTFRIYGQLHEGGVGLENGTVTVMTGIGAGLTAVTNSSGTYVIYGVSGSVQIQAKKDGYLDANLQLNVTTHNQTFFSTPMVPNQSRADYSGSYTLTISAQPVCPTGPAPFPDAARRRSYIASVVQDNSGQLFVSLSGADFIVHNGYGDDIFGRVTSFGEFRFYLGPDYYYPGEFTIAERFGDTALLVEGSVTARGTPDLISGSMSGRIIVAGTPSHPFTPLGASCPTDRFEMVRR